MLTVIDSSLGNTGSIVRALQYLNVPFCLTRDLAEIGKAQKLIFPGVGSYKTASDQVLSEEFISLIRHLVLEKKVPLFGICLGMQLLTDYGEENGSSRGLGLIKGKTSLLRIDPSKFPVPHMGWNDVRSNGLRMFQGIPENSCFYFVHSYEVIASNSETKIATVNYGDVEICAALEKGHIWGTQFHPEKSQSLGLELLKNFHKL